MDYALSRLPGGADYHIKVMNSENVFMDIGSKFLRATPFHNRRRGAGPVRVQSIVYYLFFFNNHFVGVIKTLETRT